MFAEQTEFVEWGRALVFDTQTFRQQEQASFDWEIEVRGYHKVSRRRFDLVICFEGTESEAKREATKMMNGLEDLQWAIARLSVALDRTTNGGLLHGTPIVFEKAHDASKWTPASFWTGPAI